MPEVGLSPEREEKLAAARLRWYRVCGIAGVVTCLIAVYLGFDAKADNDLGAKTRGLLVECVIPPEERIPPLEHPADTDCFTRSQQRLADGIKQIATNNRAISVVAAACGAAHPGDIPGTEACVDKALAD